MNAFELQNQAIKSALNYYDAVKQNKRGRAVISILKLRKESGSVYSVKLSQKIFTLDSICISITSPLINVEFYDDLENRYINSEHLELQHYDERTKTANLFIKNAVLVDIFESLVPDDIKLVSDLTFLIKNVGKWYRKFGDRLKAPAAPKISVNDIYLRGIESDAQINAVKTALTNNVSYIWGAPGTGKTQIVLADCILTYIDKKKVVFILAPTNNAVEQSLRAIIKALESQNVSLDCLLRLGIPSHEFASEFGDICESISNTKQTEQLQEKVDNIKHKLSKAFDKSCYTEFIGLYQKYEKLLDMISKCTYEIDSILNEQQILLKEFKKVETEYNRVNKQYKQICTETSNCESQIYRLNSEVAALKRKKNSLREKFNAFLGKSTIDKELEELSLKINKHNVEHIHKTEERQEYQELVQQLEKQLSGYASQNNNFLIRVNKLKKDKEQLDEDAQKCRYKMNSVAENATGKTFNDLSKAKNELFDIYKEYQRQVGAWQRELESLEKELSVLLEKAAARRKNKLVYAMTVDYFYTHYEELTVNEKTALSAKHIFLDEAAYLPMIKAGILFSLGSPVTLLGDHAQLPPICETDHLLSDEGNNLFMWAQSALYFPELLGNSDIHKAYLKWSNNIEPSLNTTALPNTYRFGNNLAKTLNDFVYSKGFSGRTDFDTNILVINAKHKSGPDKRTNVAELKAITDFLSASKLSDYAILTPYTNQLALLKNDIPDQDDNILTVHASQGREWDTVILSVTDAGNNWFTNSNNNKSKGKNVINTAISRAKQNIVIVCDADYWIKQSDTQLIGSLVKNATRII